jgi:hypothetical protein
MAEFCTKCALEMFGEQAQPEIDVTKEFEELQSGYVSSGYICEGCGLIAISKTEDGELKVMRIKPEDSGDQTSDWENY